MYLCNLHNAQKNIFLGWIGILAQWLKHSDIRLSASAAKSLGNLDRDANYNYTYPRGVYVLHPTLRSESEGEVDVVLVHGLLGGVFYTWRQRTSNENSTLGLLGKYQLFYNIFRIDLEASYLI